ncbi:hypothetical protein FS837_012480 [Tulasnella sp. UAMH 9824]|nr:hypothetical protein FS837_012480 [Tulasnella sp. UAMH 9824]
MTHKGAGGSIGDRVPDFTANETVGMIGLTATRGAVDVVAAVRSTVSQQHLDVRSGSAVIAAAPQLHASFGLLATPEVDLDPEERRLGEEPSPEATRPVWGLDSPRSSPNDIISLMPVVPSFSALEPPTATQDYNMQIDESVTVHNEEGADDAPQEENMSSSTSSTSSSSYSDALDDMPSDEEMMEMLEAGLETERAALSADTLQPDLHDGLVAQQNERDVEGMSIESLVEEVAMRETWGRGEEGVEEVGIAGLRAVKSDLKLASHVASSQ